jgi:adenosylcobinamide-phosphate synthase
MSLTWQILAAVLLDLLIGDPRWLPHPVRFIGRFALALEAPLRRWLRQDYAAGVVAVLLVAGGTAGIAWGAIVLAGRVHPLAGGVLGVLLIYTAIAARDLVDHSQAVFKALAAGDLPMARQKVAMIVGRDTETLDEAGVTRAAVECVAESTVDGVTAPLFFAILFGPAGAMAYRAINTLDSTFGYKSERYWQFGWASARLDDVANYLPARLTAPLVGVAAALLGLRSRLSWKILRRDGRKHASPNSGLTEAAMAGALGVRLGGTNHYGGEALEKETMGDPLESLAARHIPAANRLMLATVWLFLALGLVVRAIVLSFFAGSV